MVPTFPDVSRLSVEPVLVRGIPVKLGELLSLTEKARHLPGAPSASERWHKQLSSEALSAARDGQREYAKELISFLRSRRELRDWAARHGY
jgi:hypothetical protein